MNIDLTNEYLSLHISTLSILPGPSGRPYLSGKAANRIRNGNRLSPPALRQDVGQHQRNHQQTAEVAEHDNRCDLARLLVVLLRHHEVEHRGGSTLNTSSCPYCSAGRSSKGVIINRIISPVAGQTRAPITPIRQSLRSTPVRRTPREKSIRGIRRMPTSARAILDLCTSKPGKCC